MNNAGRVLFFSKGDYAQSFELQKGEHILRDNNKKNYTDINDIIELYHIKKYIDEGVCLKNWTAKDTANFKQKAGEFGNIVSRFMSSISSQNVESLYNNLIQEYKNSFWEIVNNYSFFNNISAEKFKTILENDHLFIRKILHFKKIVDHYNNAIRNYMLTHPVSAEIILSYYEFNNDQIYLPQSLTTADMETIILNYIDSPNANYNYLKVIRIAKNRDKFRLLDKTRLKAQKLYEDINKDLLANNKGISFNISIGFLPNMDVIKSITYPDTLTINYSYSLDFIKQNSDPYSLFMNFFYMFEYIDWQHRINLVSKGSNCSALEKALRMQSKNEYWDSINFSHSEMTSIGQIAAYIEALDSIDISLENSLGKIFTTVFPEKYGFADNSILLMPTASSYLEKVRLLAPEFESILKQYKLFVENGDIDFDLLQISSNPVAIKDIPSLNKYKYFYIKESDELTNCMNLLFSDQTTLGYVTPFESKQYQTLFDIMLNENVEFDNYLDSQKYKLKYLIEKDYIFIDDNKYLRFVNNLRVLILYDLYRNEVGSYHWHTPQYQTEIKKMKSEGLIYFENTLFSKPEQAYFNFLLNKSEFSNSMDLRNKYLHGTQANPEETEKHHRVYLIYLKMIVLALLKMDDDLMINNNIKQNNIQ